MSVFEQARQDADKEVVVKLLTTLSEEPETTHRDLATEVGISLGMMVNYMKSCIRKGYIRSKQVAPRRWAYFVTPKGLTEKTRMVTDYLHRSMTFFRDTRSQLEKILSHCHTSALSKIALVGEGDVAEIAVLLNHKFNLDISVFNTNKLSIEHLKQFEILVITDIVNPQGTFNLLRNHFDDNKVLSIEVMSISRS